MSSPDGALAEVSAVVFDPSLTSREAVEAYLIARGEAGLAHPCYHENESAGGARVLLALQADRKTVREISIGSLDPSVFLSTAKVAELRGILATLMDRHPQLFDIQGFELQLLAAGDFVSIPLVPRGREGNPPAINACVLTDKKDGNFFDASCYFLRRKVGEKASAAASPAAKGSSRRFDGKKADGGGGGGGGGGGDGDLSVITYSNKSFLGASHSGDIGALLHFMGGFSSSSFEPQADGTQTTLSFAMVGFRKRALRFFVEQQPAVLLIDYEREIIYVVPCPLDVATVGEASLVHLVGARVVDKHLECVVLQRPETVEGVDTGELMPVAASVRSVASALDAAAEARAAAAASAPTTIGLGDANDEDPVSLNLLEAASAAAGAELAAVQELMATDSSAEVLARLASCAAKAAEATKALELAREALGTSPKIPVKNAANSGGGSTRAEVEHDAIAAAVVFAQNGLGPAMDKWLQVGGVSPVFFGQGFSMKAEETMTTLPHVFGTVEGGMAPALCHLSSVVPSVDSAGVLMVLAGPIAEANMLMARHVGNCVMIIDSGLADLPLGESPEATLNKTDVSATCMAGPNSIVLVHAGSKLLWYRGVRLPGLVDTVPNYGDDVSELFAPEALSAWVASSPNFLWPRTQQVESDRRVLFDGEMQEIEAVVSRLGEFSLSQLAEATPSVLDFLTQVSVLCEASEIKTFVASIDNRLSEMLDVATSDLRKAVLAAYADGTSEDVKRCVAELKGARTKLNKVIQRISNALHNLDSQKGVSKRTQSIAARQRRDKIAGNVAKVQDMSMSEKLELFDQYCENMLLLTMEPDNLYRCLKAVGEDDFRKQVSKAKPGALQFRPEQRMPFLDPFTFQSLLELTHEGAQHALAGPANMAIPQGHTDEAQLVACVGFPLLNEAVALKDPSFVNWAEEANKESYALYRIMLRGLFSQATASRAFIIGAQSDELGYFLIHLLLCAMESLVANMSAVPDPTTDWESTNCEAMRGLMAQLLSVMASTQKTLCPAFSLVYKNPKLRALDVSEMWVVPRMLRVFPYTCWDPANINRNVRRLLSQTVLKLTAAPAIDQMQKAVSQEKKVQVARSPEFFDFCRLVVDVVMWSAGYGAEDAVGDPPGLTAGQAAKLLELSPDPDHLTNGTVHMSNHIKSIRDTLKHVALHPGWPTGFVSTVQVALFSYLKHAQLLNAQEHGPIKQGVHKLSSVSEYVTYYAKLADKAGGIWNSSDHPEHQSKFASVVGISKAAGETAVSMLSAAEAEGNASTDGTVAARPPTTAEILEQVAGSKKAVALAQSLETLTAETVGIHKEFADLLGLLHIDGAPDTVLRDMINAMLLRWKTHDGAVEAGMAILGKEEEEDADANPSS